MSGYQNAALRFSNYLQETAKPHPCCCQTPAHGAICHKHTAPELLTHLQREARSIIHFIGIQRPPACVTPLSSSLPLSTSQQNTDKHPTVKMPTLGSDFTPQYPGRKYIPSVPRPIGCQHSLGFHPRPSSNALMEDLCGSNSVSENEMARQKRSFYLPTGMSRLLGILWLSP